MSEASLPDPTLSEIKSAIDEQKLTSEIIIKFFEVSNPQDITTKFSNINEYIKDRVQLGIRDLMISIFFNKEERRRMCYTEIKANYLNMYTDISKLKEQFEKIKIPHLHGDIKNVVYTIGHGTIDLRLVSV